MSTWPLLKYVDAPATTATVRYDFNDQAATPSKKVTEFDPGVPTLEGDPDAVGQQWGFRSPQLVHTIRGTKAQGMAALSAVSKELLRRTNWLLFQPSAATQPVWFKTYRTGGQPITLDRVYVRVDGGGTAPLPDTWKITVPMVADAFTYGARVVMSTFQVIQSPADLAGPVRTAMRVVLPAIKGDAPTALRVQLTQAASSAIGDTTWFLGCSSGTAAMTDPVVDIGTGDVFSAGPNTAGGVANAADFSGSCRTITVTPNDSGVGGNNFTGRLDGNFSGIQPGRYKVLVRFEAESGALGVPRTYLFSFQAGKPGWPGDTQRTTVGTNSGSTQYAQGWIDLGDFAFPPRFNAPDDIAATLPSTLCTLKVGEASNLAGVVRIDAFKLVPIAGRTVTSATILKATNVETTIGLKNIFDGDQESLTAITSGGVFNQIPLGVTLSGGFVVADPAAAQNLLTVMALGPNSTGAHSTTSPASKDSQTAVDVSYYPRYLHVGDGT